MLAINCFFNTVQAQNFYEQELQYLDSIRSSDNLTFLRRLAEFESSAKTLSSYEKQYLKYLQAYRATFSGNLSEGVKLSKELSNPSVDTNIRFRSNLLLLNTLAISKNWQEGMAYLTDIIDSLPKVTSSEIKHTGIAVILQTYNEYRQYEENLNFKFDDIADSPSHRNNCLIYWFRLEAQIKSKRVKVGSPKFTQALHLCEQANEPMVIATVRLREAQLLLDAKESDQAISTLLTAYKQIEKVNYRRLTTEANATLAKAYLLKNSFDRAENFALSVVNNMEGLETTEPASVAYRVLYLISKEQKKHEQALDYYEKYTIADRAYLGEIEAKEIAFQKAKQNSLQQKNRNRAT